jgi:negative regulator of sigma E activity
MSMSFELVPEMLSAYLDDELTVEERVAVEARLVESVEWRAELHDVRAARDAVRDLASRDAPAGFWDAVLAHVETVDDVDESDDVPTAAPVVALTERRSRRRVAWFAAAAAAIAGVVVAVIAIPQRSEVTPNVTAVVAQHGAQGSDAADPISMLAPVGPLAGFRR